MFSNTGKFGFYIPHCQLHAIQARRRFNRGRSRWPSWSALAPNQELLDCQKQNKHERQPAKGDNEAERHESILGCSTSI